ncbi:hypothetical protein D3C87_1682050 [compost metagenome]
MAHQDFIIAKELSQFGLIVGEQLLSTKLLAVAGETGVDWIAAAVNDACPGKNQRNQAGIEEVAWHLIDQAVSSLGQGRYLLKIILTNAG